MLKRLTVFLLSPLLLVLPSCDSGGPTSSQPLTAVEAPKAPNAIEVVFVYGSEKEKWIDAVTPAFNQSKTKTASGKPIFVKPIPAGSGETISGVMDGSMLAHIVSPASEAFIKLGNAESRVKTNEDLVGETEALVLSPVIIAMWQPMAEALGWGEKPIGWKEIHDLTMNPEGWASLGHPEWGKFRFGHTHPDYSNSGLISLFAEVYAAAGKTNNLTLEDVRKPATGQYLEEIEQAIVHYGRSTGFFGRKLLANGPGYLSAAVLYENLVIESYSDEHNLPFPVVAIYPKEGTFWSDHPAGIVNRDWVTPEHEEAAQIYLDYLLEGPQQERALEFGFRPADVSIPISAPVDLAHGVDPNQPSTLLEVPEVPVMEAIRELWKERKKKANVVLCLDVSGSMQYEGKMDNARSGAVELIQMLGDRDTFSFMPFNHQPMWSAQNVSVGKTRADMVKKASNLYADGGTAMYDAVIAAHEYLDSAEGGSDGKITAIVVLSDGADEHSEQSLDQLLERIDVQGEIGNVRIFTIGYGKGARAQVLKQIAEATQAKYFEGTPENIGEVFKEISTFF